MELFNLNYHYGGHLNKTAPSHYVGGEETLAMNIDPDKLDFWLLFSLPKEMGIDDEIEDIYYLVPGESLNAGLHKLSGDKDVIEIGRLGMQVGVVDLYVVHKGDENQYNTSIEYPAHSPFAEGIEENSEEGEQNYRWDDGFEEPEHPYLEALDGGKSDTSDEEWTEARDRVEKWNMKTTEEVKQATVQMEEGTSAGEQEQLLILDKEVGGCVSEYEDSDGEVDSPGDSEE
ncbi:unnamed protein product, partial [Cuscuta epithymum]